MIKSNEAVKNTPINISSMLDTLAVIYLFEFDVFIIIVDFNGILLVIFNWYLIERERDLFILLFSLFPLLYQSVMLNVKSSLAFTHISRISQFFLCCNCFYVSSFAYFIHFSRDVYYRFDLDSSVAWNRWWRRHRRHYIIRISISYLVEAVFIVVVVKISRNIEKLKLLTRKFVLSLSKNI